MDTTEPRFVVVATLADLADGELVRISLDGHALVLGRSGDAIHAFQSTCPHEQTDLSQGRIENGRIVCGRHLASFALCDGHVSGGWKVPALKLYPVRVEGNAIAVDADAVRLNPPGGSRKTWDLTGG